jgi:hypothetical protein
MEPESLAKNKRPSVDPSAMVGLTDMPVPDEVIIRNICSLVMVEKIQRHQFRSLYSDSRAFIPIWEALGIPEVTACSCEWVRHGLVTYLVEGNYPYGVVLETLMSGYRCDTMTVATALRYGRPDLALLLLSTLSGPEVRVLGPHVMASIFGVIQRNDDVSRQYESLAPGITLMLMGAQ